MTRVYMHDTHMNTLVPYVAITAAGGSASTADITQQHLFSRHIKVYSMLVCGITV